MILFHAVSRTAKKFVVNALCRLLTPPPLFSAVEIETINRCNGLCGFCPVNRRLDARPLARMSDRLLQKILRELSALSFSGFLGIQSNNEPFLDKKIIDRVGAARRYCPNAHLYMYTNGTLLNVERLGKLLDTGIDSVVIDNYSNTLTLHENIRIIDSHFKAMRDRRYIERVTIVVQPENAVRTNRGGSAPNKQGPEYDEYKELLGVGCLLPFKQIVIRPDGKISLCCQDALGAVTLGNVNKHSLLEIWSGEQYSQLRQELARNGRRNLALCKKCDLLAASRQDLKLLCSRIVRRRVASVGYVNGN